MLFAIIPGATPDDKILTRLLRGDREALSLVYERYFASLYQYIRWKTGDAQLSEDLSSEVFVQLIESIGSTAAPRHHLRAWLFQVARNLIAQHFARNPEWISYEEMEERMPAQIEMNPDELADAMFDIERVRRVMRMLTPDHQEVLLLRFGQRMSLQETSELMGKSQSAIKSLQFRAVDTLRQLLNVNNEEADHVGS